MNDRLVVTGGLALILVALLACKASKSKEQAAAEQAEIDTNVANAADAAEHALDVQKAAVRKGCKMKETSPVFIVADEDLRYRCHELVREGLKVQGSGDFPSLAEEPSPTLTSTDGCNRTYTSFVDAKNALGVQVRTRYACTLDPRTGNFSTKML